MSSPHDNKTQQKIAAKLSIVIPVFNEESTITPTILDCVRKVAFRFEQFEVIVVDDCSHDGTAEKLATIGASLPQLKVLKNDINRGHGPSLQRGLSMVSGDLAFMLDSDFQHDPEHFWKLYPTYNEDTIVTGLRSTRADEWYRRSASNIGNRLVRTLCGVNARDINIPFKIIPENQLRILLDTLPQPALIPSALLIIGASHFGFSVVQHEIPHRAREYGTTTLPGARFAKFAIQAILEIIQYRKSLQSKNRMDHILPS